jgi:hypothetical protein
VKVRFLVLIGVLLAASACSWSDGDSSSPNSPAASSGRDAARPSREALVYAAVIRQLVTKDHGFGGAPSPYRRVYVLNGVVPSAANAMRLVSQPRKPFSDSLRRQIIATLKGLPPVAFVETRGVVITGSGLGHVVHRGVLITLGPIRWVNAHTARVPNNRWETGLNGQWLTYSLKAPKLGLGGRGSGRGRSHLLSHRPQTPVDTTGSVSRCRRPPRR